MKIPTAKKHRLLYLYKKKATQVLKFTKSSNLRGHKFYLKSTKCQASCLEYKNLVSCRFYVNDFFRFNPKKVKKNVDIMPLQGYTKTNFG